MANEAELADHLRTTPRSQARHTALIADLVASHPDMQTKGFWRAVRSLADELGAEIWDHRFRPDAFRINRETQTIEIHEVVVSHDLPRRTLQMMGMFWFDWDCEGDHDWLPTLWVHREGAKPQEYDLCYWYHATVRDDALSPHEQALAS